MGSVSFCIWIFSVLHASVLLRLGSAEGLIFAGKQLEDGQDPSPSPSASVVVLRFSVMLVVPSLVLYFHGLEMVLYFHGLEMADGWMAYLITLYLVTHEIPFHALLFAFCMF